MAGLTPTLSADGYFARKTFTQTGGANQVIMLQNGSYPVYFTKATFYGMKGKDVSDKAIANAASVFVGEKDQAENTIFIDEVTADLKNPLVIQAAPGMKLCLDDFYVKIMTAGDGIFIKYQ